MRNLLALLVLLSGLASAITCPGVAGRYLFGEAAQPKGTQRECGLYYSLYSGFNSGQIKRFEMFKVSADYATILPRVLSDMNRLGYTMTSKDISKDPLNITLGYSKPGKTIVVVIMELDGHVFLIDAQ